LDERVYRVLFVENGLGFGGAVISLRTFLKHADRSRYHAILVHSLDEPRFATFKGIAETRHVRRLRLGTGLLSYFARRLNIDVARDAFRLARMVRREKADLVYLNNDLMNNLAGLLAARILGIPVVLHERDIPLAQSGLARLVANWPEHYLAISGPVREALLRYGVSANKITMVPEGLDLDMYQLASADDLAQLRTELGISSNAPLVVLAGMVMSWKGQHVLLDAVPAVLAAYPEARFVIVGEPPPGGGGYLKFLKDKTYGLGVQDAVLFSGYRQDIPRLMQAADIVVHASVSPEPFGRVVIEGMVMGSVVIATDIGAPPEIIRSSETGYLVPPDDPRALAERIIEVLSDPDSASAIGRAARADAVHKYAVERHVALIEGVFKSILKPENGAIVTDERR
jgi:glycosyltransferase involved in cell wall biosynthesis